MKGNSLKEDFEYVNCAFCDKDDSLVIFKGRDRRHKIGGEFNIVKCKTCGLVYINPRPKTDEIKKFYPLDYLFYKRINETKDKQKFFGQILPHRLKRTLGLIKRKLKDFCVGSFHVEFSKIWYLEGLKKGTILDIGCGRGEYLKMLKDSGWKVKGVDMNEQAAKQAMEYLEEGEVWCGELTDCDFSQRSFDVISMYSAFEHIHNPSEMLCKIHNLLKDNGLLVIYLQNIDSLEFKIFGKYWYHLDIPRHLYDYSKRTLRALLLKNGFLITKILDDPDPNGIIYSLNWLFEDKGVPLHLPYNKLTYRLFLPFGVIFSRLLHNGAKILICARKK